MLHRIVLSVLMLAFSAVPVSACVCVPLEPAEEAKRAELIFTGRLVATNVIRVWHNVPITVSADGEELLSLQRADQEVLWTIETDLVYKGEVGALEHIEVHLASSCLIHPLHTGRRLLVVGMRDAASGRVETNYCYSTGEVRRVRAWDLLALFPEPILSYSDHWRAVVDSRMEEAGTDSVQVRGPLQ